MDVPATNEPVMWRFIRGIIEEWQRDHKTCIQNAATKPLPWPGGRAPWQSPFYWQTDNGKTYQPSGWQCGETVTTTSTGVLMNDPQ